DVNDEAGEHQERGQIVNDVTHRYHPPSHQIVKPHQQSGDQKQDAAHNNRPEIEFLTAIEKSDLLGLESVFISDVVAHLSHPTPIHFCPRHRRHPIEELEKEEDIEQQTE